MKRLVTTVLVFVLGLVITIYKDSLLNLADSTRPDRPKGLTAPTADQILAEVRSALSNKKRLLPDETAAVAALRTRTSFLVQYGFVDELEELAARVHSPDLRFPSGMTYLNAFHEGATSIGIGSDETYINCFRHWAKRKPDSVTAHVALANAYRKWGWHTRAKDDVSVSESGKTLEFNKRMLQSQIALEKAEKISDDDVQIDLSRMWLMTGLGKRGAVNDAFEAAVKKDPNCLPAYLARTVSLLPLNGGKSGEWLEFARTAGPKYLPDTANALFARIVPAIQIDFMSYDVAWNPEPDQLDTVSWPELNAAFRDATNAWPNSARLLNRYARMAFQTGDLDVVRETVRLVGNQFDRSAIQNEWLWKAYQDYATLPDRLVSAHPVKIFETDAWKAVTDLAFSKDGRILAVADHGGDVCIWNMETLRPAVRLPGENLPANGIAFSPDGRLLGVAHGDLSDTDSHGTAAFWDTGRWGKIRTLVTKSEASSITFSDNGAKAAVTAYSDTGKAEIHIVDLKDYRRSTHTVAKGVHLRKPSFTGKNSETLITAVHHTINVNTTCPSESGIHCVGTNKWDISCYSIIWDYEISPDRELLAVGRGPRWVDDQEPGRLELWRMKTWEPVRLTEADSIGGMKALAWSLDGKYLFAGGQDQVITVWEAKSLKKRALLAGHRAAITSLTLSPNGKYLVSGSYDCRAFIWDAADILARVESTTPPLAR